MGRSFILAVLALAAASVSPTPLRRADARQDDRPDGALVLGVLGHSAGSRVVSREQIVVADPRTGRLRARRLPGGTLCDGPLLALAGHVVFSGYEERRAVARVLPLSLAGRARSLGRADAIAASAPRSRLWLASWAGPRRGGWTDRPVRVGLRQVDLAGRVSARGTSFLPRFASVHAATGSRFVATEGRWLTLRRLGRARPLRRARDGWFLGAAARTVAWCGGRCDALHVWRGTGQRVLRPPVGVDSIGPAGSLSADGGLLATEATLDGRARVAVVDLQSRRWTLVAGGRLRGYRAIGWSPSGEWLYFTAGKRRLVGWRVGGERAATLPIRPRGTVMSIATAEVGG